MKYEEIRTVLSGGELKKEEFPGMFNIEVGEYDKVIVPEHGKSAAIFFGSPYDVSNWKGIQQIDL